MKNLKKYFISRLSLWAGDKAKTILNKSLRKVLHMLKSSLIKHVFYQVHTSPPKDMQCLFSVCFMFPIICLNVTYKYILARVNVTS